MIKDDVYEKLREKISLWPIKVPKTNEAIEMLKTLFTYEDAEFLLHFKAPYQDAETMDQIVERTGKPLEQIQPIVDHLVSRGLLFRFKSKSSGLLYFSLMPMVPGIFEFYFASGGSSDEKRKVSKLFERLYLNGGGMELGASEYPWARVMPIEKTVFVNRQISTGHKILPYEKMSEFIKTSRKIAVMNCACRIHKECDHPLETCLVFDYFADFMVERGFAKYLSTKEALQLLDEMERKGLVHSTTNVQTRPQFICNCCTCACAILRGLTELHNPRSIAKSNFIPIRDDAVCSKCKKCILICPMEANVYHAPHDYQTEKIIFLEERCIGCGLCAYHCSKEAIKMKKVKDDVPELTPKQAMIRVEAERIH